MLTGLLRLLRPSRELRQLLLLDEIGSGRPVSQRSLARRAGISCAMANAYVDALVGRGLLEVTGETNRSYRYRLTNAGHARRDELFLKLTLETSRLARRVEEEARRFLRGRGAA